MPEKWLKRQLPLHLCVRLSFWELSEQGPYAWAPAENFPGGNIDILLIFFKLLTMQCKWTLTKDFTLSTPQR